ncbi:hypothetical protein SAMN05192575_101385 [Nocardioides alpinus]|uniref:Uncharacterized protein n=1 Tax=Nocardioides alpinus TaxID=748909 RepID=A0A1I0VRF8_9ACTN|nr:hypothetical protein SAMN05192575_101385 [Nocardioides alpinus]
MAAMRSGTPAPVAADPAKTGCSLPERVCSAARASSCSAVRSRPSTYDASSASSFSASATVSRSWNSGSSGEYAANVAVLAPSPAAVPMGRTSGVRRLRIASSTASTSAPARSILLTNSSVGTPSRCRARIRIRVCGCTPSTADRTSTAPSSTPSTRSTSAMKSGCPGVSITLTTRSPTGNATTAALMVMPRRRSRSRLSVWVVPASTDPGWSMTPAMCRSRSVRVVLPASTWARMPRLSERARSGRGDTRGPFEEVDADGSVRCSHLDTSWDVALTAAGRARLPAP